MAGSTTSEGSKEDQQRPSSETLIVPSLEFTARVAPLFTGPTSENLLVRILIWNEFSLGKSR